MFLSTTYTLIASRLSLGSNATEISLISIILKSDMLGAVAVIILY